MQGRARGTDPVRWQVRLARSLVGGLTLPNHDSQTDEIAQPPFPFNSGRWTVSYGLRDKTVSIQCDNLSPVGGLLSVTLLSGVVSQHVRPKRTELLVGGQFGLSGRETISIEQATAPKKKSWVRLEVIMQDGHFFTGSTRRG